MARLDIAATVRFEGAMEAYEWERWNEFLAWRKRSGPGYVGNYQEDEEKGATCYVGSPSSEVRLRIYNKGREAEKKGTAEEAEHYRLCHRFELQLRNARSCAMAASLSDPTDRALRIRATLAGFCEGRGIMSTDLSSAPMALVPGFRRRSDDDTSLGWLETQVRPTLARLAAKGMTAQISGALGLQSIPNCGNHWVPTIAPKGVWRAPRL